MNFIVIVSTADAEMVLSIDASNADEAEALAVRASGPGSRVLSNEQIDANAKAPKRDINDGKPDAKLIEKKFKHRL